MPIKAVLFDMDGVLADFKEIHFKTLNLSLIAHGYKPIEQDQHLERFDGLPTKKKLQLLGLDAKEIGSVAHLKQKFTVELIKYEYKQNLDTLNAIKILKNEGYRMALCTNSVRETAELFLKLSEYDYYFEFYLSNQDVNKPKPHPEIYNQAVEQLGLEPNEVLVLEDNRNGLEAASRAGCHVLQVTEGVKEVTYRFIRDRITILDSSE